MGESKVTVSEAVLHTNLRSWHQLFFWPRSGLLFSVWTRHGVVNSKDMCDSNGIYGDLTFRTLMAHLNSFKAGPSWA